MEIGPRLAKSAAFDLDSGMSAHVLPKKAVEALRAVQSA
jgi:hypothetical protein